MYNNNNFIVLLKNISISQQNEIILDNIDLSLNRGEFAYLIGKSGAGKSTLLKLLYGDFPVQQGNGYVVGMDLKQLNRKTIPLLRRKLGIVFQDFNLLSDRDVEDNLFFALQATGWKDRTAMNKRINEVLTDVGLLEVKNRMPHQLSGGEKQRVVIARALLNTPELIIADEPTGNLDPQTSMDIIEIIRRISKENNTAVLFATHDYELIDKYPARIIRCHDKKLHELDV